MLEHKAGGSKAPLKLVLPVACRPELVYTAIAGILGGQIKLSLSTVEAILVLSNAIGVRIQTPTSHMLAQCSHVSGFLPCTVPMQIECLEAACVQFLIGQAPLMDGHAVYCLVTLADHLGLSSLCEAAAEAFIRLPWEDNMAHFKVVLNLPVYKKNSQKLYSLLHHPQRGAFTELQVLQVLEDCAVAQSVIACCGLDWETLRPAELHTILGILSQPKRPPGILLQRAVQQHLVYKALPPLPSKQAPGNWSPVHIVHGLMLPDAEHPEQDITLPESELELRLEYNTSHGKETCSTAFFCRYNNNSHIYTNSCMCLIACDQQHSAQNKHPNSVNIANSSRVSTAQTGFTAQPYIHAEQRLIMSSFMVGDERKITCSTAAHTCHYASASGHMLPGFNMLVTIQHLDKRQPCVRESTHRCADPIRGMTCRQT